MAIIEITITVALATTTFFFSESLIPNTPSNIFSVTLDEAAKSCESDVDMVDARIPARIIPATMAKIKPCLLITVEIWTIIVSESNEPYAPKIPSVDILNPIMPIKIAAAMEITTHVLAIRLDNLTFSGSSIAINLNKICGMPKYPSPHANVEIIVIIPYWLAELVAAL